MPKGIGDDKVSLDVANISEKPERRTTVLVFGLLEGFTDC